MIDHRHGKVSAGKPEARLFRMHWAVFHGMGNYHIMVSGLVVLAPLTIMLLGLMTMKIWRPGLAGKTSSQYRSFRSTLQTPPSSQRMFGLPFSFR